jgi:fructokinase
VPDRQLPVFAVVGEAVLDLTAPGEDGVSFARPGGSPMNVAIGLARLGQPTAFVGRVSDDPVGTVLRHHLEQSGVDLQHVVEATDPSTIALVELSAGQARYQFSRRGADFQWSPAELAFLPGGAHAVHFGSLASWLPPGDVAIADMISRLRSDGSVLISYDPNVRPALLPDITAARRKVERCVSVAHVVKASVEDSDWLYAEEAVDAVARRWLDLGAEIVVVTSGAHGATAWTKHQPPVSRPAFPTSVVDTVGAGDAFMSGLLDSLARRGLLAPAALADLRDEAWLAAVLDDASLIAGITVGRAGADPPSRAEADASGRASILGDDATAAKRPPDHDWGDP